MKHLNSSYWIKPKQLLNSRLEPQIRSWLQDQGSLTKRLIKQCPGRFSVQVLSQQWGKASFSDAKLLNIPPHQRVLLRLVILKCDEKCGVYAQSIIPLKTLHGRHNRLKYLNQHPLGAYLFNFSSLKRSRVDWTCIEQNDPLRRNMQLDRNNKKGKIWGRRSLFELNQKKLIVSEFFLPHLFQLDQNQQKYSASFPEVNHHDS